MRYTGQRKHPRVYDKSLHEKGETAINLSLAAAVGILAFTFLKGIFWGYMIRKRLD